MSDDLEVLARIASTPMGRIRMRHFGSGTDWPAGPVAKARMIARAAHEGQVDKAGRPYIEHPERVALALQSNGADDLTIAAGWLHDAVEDTDVTLDDIAVLLGLGGSEVAMIVEALTHRPHEPLEDYWDRIRSNPDAVVVKLADLDDNSHPARLARLDEATRARLTAKYARARAALTNGADDA